MTATTLAGELDAHGRSMHRHMTGAQCRQPVGAVRRDVALVADPDVCALEQGHHERHDPLIGQTVAGQIVVQRAAQRAERLAERDELVELRAFPFRTELGVVPVLLPTACVASGGLQVTIGIAADPDVGPCRRHRDGADAFQGLGRRDRLLRRRVRVPKPLRPGAPNARLLVGDEPETTCDRNDHGAAVPENARTQADFTRSASPSPARRLSPSRCSVSRRMRETWT